VTPCHALSGFACGKGLDIHGAERFAAYGPIAAAAGYVVLDKDGVAFFRSSANGKSPTDRLFTAAEGKPWRRDMWAEQVRSAITLHNKRAPVKARIPDGASAYSFRHARISELLQVYGVDPLTVAAQTGTSLRMIERAYFKFIRSAMLEKIAGLSARSPGD
jgi:integrase